jgi:inositol-phosphate phosphatase / L-galactose 1-phosphate phosphatase / histidinol-phosphatase
MNQEEALELSQHLADVSRFIALRYFRTSLDIRWKEDASPVTIADCKIESTLRSVIRDRYPDHGIIGEEYDCTPGGRYSWILDPIDGTKSFTMGNPLFGTLIGLLDDGQPIAGLVDLPAMGERWAGTGRRTTFADGINNGQANVSGCRSIEAARLYITPPPGADSDEKYAGIETLYRVAAITHPVCDCYAYGLLASGYCDLVVEDNLEPCDYLPLVPIINGAGGQITDWTGKPLTLNSDGRVIAASTECLLEAAIEVLHSPLTAGVSVNR